MDAINSQAIYMAILERLISDIAIAYVDSDVTRDLKKLRQRVAGEGFSFVTKTLPSLEKSFIKALQGTQPFAFPGFAARKSTPKFLWWLFERVIGPDGMVRSDADVRAIRDIRQILQLFYKLELPSTHEQKQKVLSTFEEVNQELKKLEIDFNDAVIKRARGFISRALLGCSPVEVIPSHGPGAVATGEKGGQKSHFSRLYKDIELMYPFTEYYQLSLNHTVDTLELLQGLEVLDTGTAKVVLVPKDSRGPRLISCEPLEKQWIQQGQRKALYHHIERSPITSGHVNFTSQEINRLLALESSQTQEWVTLDMKEASDRVSMQLVDALFAGSPWGAALRATRSGETRLPNGTLVQLSTFAPMGSAVCFPIEALVFYALAVSTICVRRGIHWRVAKELVYVYGDDIICKREDYPFVMQSLERFGLKFNPNKCCVSGFFRESCGCDAYKGVDITPVRLRKTWSHRNRWNATQLQSYVEFSNSMYRLGYRRVARYVELLVESLYGPIPVVTYTEPSEWEYDLNTHTLNKKCKLVSQQVFAPPGRVIGFDRPDVNPITENRKKGVKTRFSKGNPLKKNEFHRLEVYGYSVLPVHKHWLVDGWEALFRTLLCGSTGLPSGVHAIPRRSRMKRSWGPV